MQGRRFLGTLASEVHDRFELNGSVWFFAANLFEPLSDLLIWWKSAEDGIEEVGDLHVPCVRLRVFSAQMVQ